MSELLAGQVVAVYKKPHDEEEFEGHAKLLRRSPYDDSDGLEWWVVEFKDEPGGQYTRKVAERHIVN